MVGRVEFANFLINNRVDKFFVDVDGKLVLVTFEDFVLDDKSGNLVLRWNGVKK
jgi:hypothetical protein